MPFALSQRLSFTLVGALIESLALQRLNVAFSAQIYLNIAYRVVGADCEVCYRFSYSGQPRRDLVHHTVARRQNSKPRIQSSYFSLKATIRMLRMTIIGRTLSRTFFNFLLASGTSS